MHQRTGLLPLATAAVFALIILFHLTSARAGYSHYRDIHLGSAVEFWKHGVDFFRPVIVGFNATGTPTPQELPLWQATAGWMFRWLGLWFGWANLVSLTFFATALYPLFGLARQHLGSRGAWWTLLFFLTQPLVSLYAGVASPDGLSLAAVIWFLFSADALLRTERWSWLLPSIAFGALAAVMKLPFFFAAGLASVLLLFHHGPDSWRRWLFLGSAGLASGILFMTWTHYTDSCLAQAEFPFVHLSLKGDSPMWAWYFGTWSYRLNPANWFKGGWMGLNSLCGSFVLAGPALWAFFFGRPRVGRFWLIGALATTLVFSHLVLVHRHYYLMFAPAVALLGATAALYFEDLAALSSRWREHLAEVAICGLLLMGTAQGLIGMEVVLNYDPYPHAISRTMAEHTGPEDRLLVFGGSWGGNELMLSDRRGMSLRALSMLEDEPVYQRLRSLGYNKLVLISESPLLHALQATNPGSANRQRTLYGASLTPAVSAMKTVHESNDILIKDLP